MKCIRRHLGIEGDKKGEIADYKKNIYIYIYIFVEDVHAAASRSHAASVRI